MRVSQSRYNSPEWRTLLVQTGSSWHFHLSNINRMAFTSESAWPYQRDLLDRLSLSCPPLDLHRVGNVAAHLAAQPHQERSVVSPPRPSIISGSIRSSLLSLQEGQVSTKTQVE